MARFDSIKETIDSNIRDNRSQGITGSVLNSVLKGMVNATDEELSVAMSDLEEYIKENGGGGVKDITYADLKTLIENSSLQPGTFYHISDYETTAIGEGLSVSDTGTHYSLMVFASGVKNLYPVGFTFVNGEGDIDRYFTIVWYDINNNTSQYAWADDVNGKGVIYRMIDMYGNDVPYDFLSIKINGEDTFTGKKSAYRGNKIKAAYSGNAMVIGMNKFRYASEDSPCINNILGSNCTNNLFECIGGGISGNVFGDNCEGNHLHAYAGGISGNVFGDNCVSNTLEGNCNNNLFGAKCSDIYFDAASSYNKIGDECSDIDIGLNCSGNIIESESYEITISDSSNGNHLHRSCSDIQVQGAGNKISGESYNIVVVGDGNTIGFGCSLIMIHGSYNEMKSYCYGNLLGFTKGTDGNYVMGNEVCVANVFEAECEENVLGDGANRNYFGQMCRKNILGKCYRIHFDAGCYENSIGNSCGDIYFHSYCYRNTIGSNSTCNVFGLKCNVNILGSYAIGNTFGNGCFSITLGSYYYYNHFGDFCGDIQFQRSNGTKLSYVGFNRFENSASAKLIICTATTSSTAMLQNLIIAGGRTKLTIPSAHDIIIQSAGLSYCTRIEQKSDGSYVQYCAADLV